MSKEQDKFEREQAASRLKQARQRAGYRGAKTAADHFGWPTEKYKAHDDGRNGFGTADARKYAKAYGVSVEWLVLGTGDPYDAKRIAMERFSEPTISIIEEIDDKFELLAMEEDPDDRKRLLLEKFKNFLDIEVPAPPSPEKKR